jgi:hypothetical protein
MSQRSRRLLFASLAFASWALPGAAQCIVDQWAGPEPTGGLWLGLHMAADGEWLAVTNGNTIGPGEVHLLRRQPGGNYAWFQTVESPLEIAAFDFGKGLDLRGEFLAVGAPSFNPDQAPESAVYLFEFDGTEWAFAERFTAPNEPNNTNFGRSLSLGPDGLAVGASTERVFLPQPGPLFADNAGAVYLYRREGDDWNPDGRITAANPANFDQFGAQVELTRTTDGLDQLVVGMPGADFHGSNAGSVQVYIRLGQSQWLLTHALEPQSVASFGGFGEGLAVDGDRLIVASPRGGLTVEETGLFDAFDYVAPFWVRTQTFAAAEDLTASNFQSAIDLSGDHLAVGTPQLTSILPEQGAALRFERVDGQWQQGVSALPKFPQSAQNFGTSVAWLDTDPPRLATSASNDLTYGPSHGLVYQHEWQADACQTFFSDLGTVSLAEPGGSLLRLEPPSGSEGSLYFVLGSTSGTEPGLPVDGQLLPLTVDAYFLQTLTQPNTPPLTDGLGTFVGAWGTALVSFVLPAGLDPALAGSEVHHAYVVIDPLLGQVVHASNAVLHVLVP